MKLIRLTIFKLINTRASNITIIHKQRSNSQSLENLAIDYKMCQEIILI
jgi:hypothetical protein